MMMSLQLLLLLVPTVVLHSHSCSTLHKGTTHVSPPVPLLTCMYVHNFITFTPPFFQCIFFLFLYLLHHHPLLLHYLPSFLSIITHIFYISSLIHIPFLFPSFFRLSSSSFRNSMPFSFFHTSLSLPKILLQFYLVFNYVIHTFFLFFTPFHNIHSFPFSIISTQTSLSMSKQTPRLLSA